jgi:hypothetical protein
MDIIALVFALAIICEGIVEYIFSPLPSQYKPYVAAALGVLVCVAYNADVLALLGAQAGVPYVGAVLTGLLIGRGSSYMHDIVSRIRTVAAPATTVGHVEAVAERAEAKLEL